MLHATEIFSSFSEHNLQINFSTRNGEIKEGSKVIGLCLLPALNASNQSLSGSKVAFA